MMGCTVMLLLAMPSCSAFSPVSGTNNHPSSKGGPLYSEATQERIRNLDVSTEFSKLAQKMQKPPDELKKDLAERLSKATSVTEKEEYMDWLLSGFERDMTLNPKELNRSKPGSAASISVKKFTQSPIRPRKSNFVQDDNTSTYTNDSVAQTHVVVPKGTNMITTVVETIKCAIESHINHDNDSSSRFTVPPKIVVFFPKPRMAQFYAEIFQQINGGVLLTSNTGDGAAIRIPTWELHSKRYPEFRTRVNEEFSKAEVGVLFISDTRGVDYPNVSHVIQFGMPKNEKQYIHRLGLAGQNGKKGKGWLVLQEWESAFLGELNGMNIIEGINVPQSEELVDRIVRGNVLEHSKAIVGEVQRRVQGRDRILSKTGVSAYVAFLDYYTSQFKRMRMDDVGDLVAIANDFAFSLGFKKPPQLQKSTLGRMGLVGIAGLNTTELGGTGRHKNRVEGRGRGSVRYRSRRTRSTTKSQRTRRETHKSRSVR